MDIESIFPALDVQTAQRVIWRKASDHSENGVYWVGIDRSGIHWVCDGQERIAALPARIFRFFRQGVASRCNRLIDKYLRDMVSVSPGDTVINIGANIGELAITLAERGAAVLAIEPDPSVLPLLRANAAERSIEVVPFAAWNADGPLEMYLASESADTSVFNVTKDRFTANATRIDTMMRGRSIERVRLIIGDAEGAEPEALEGAAETLKITDYVSIRASAERCGESTLEACEAILARSGFDILYREETGFCTLIAKSRE
jgi:FkbM family methyltransferase